MRPRLLVPCLVLVAATTLPVAPASAAPTKRCKADDGVYVQYRVLRGSAKSVTCGSAFQVVLKGVLDQRPPSGWRCRTPADAAWPHVESCEKRTRGRRVATADLYATDDFFGPGSPPKD